MTDRTSLGHWIRRFLLEYAASERNLSANTCTSYRDMLVLLLPFVAKRKGVAADALSVTDLSVELVRSFLVYLEQERQCCTEPATRVDSCIGAVHRRAQPPTCRVVYPDSNGADEEGHHHQLDVPREVGSGCFARCPRPIVNARTARPRVAAVPLQLRCSRQRSSFPPDRRHRLALQVRSDHR